MHFLRNKVVYLGGSFTNLNKTTTLTRAITRHVHAGQKAEKSTSSLGSSVLLADQGSFATKFFHATQTGLLVSFPLIFIAGPPLSTPIDLALGIAMPIHGHIAMNYVLSDYGPKLFKVLGTSKSTQSLGMSIFRAGLLAASAAGLFGLLHLNLMGPGISETLKDLYREEKKVVEEEK
mmetsp:Transcript_25928/g.33621  ORF Transcript_25928/g.33621 Transcript_25928/m.33621 type:complete len:177 (+) Transcript_25928:146-676(+)